jgi:hypothetical protein
MVSGTPVHHFAKNSESEDSFSKSGEVFRDYVSKNRRKSPPECSEDIEKMLFRKQSQEQDANEMREEKRSSKYQQRNEE